MMLHRHFEAQRKQQDITMLSDISKTEEADLKSAYDGLIEPAKLVGEGQDLRTAEPVTETPTAPKRGRKRKE